MPNNIIDFTEKQIMKLPAAAMAGRLMAYPARQRLGLLLNRQDAETVVTALPLQDFYLFTKELDSGSNAPLLALASPEQLNHLADLDCWQRDHIEPDKMLRWCSELLAASEPRFLAWIHQADFELLVVVFKHWLNPVELVDDPDELQELLDHLPPHTLDNQFFFNIPSTEHQGVIMPLLNYLFANHQGFYQALMHHVHGFSENELSEQAYRFHRGRLADEAIPDFVEASTIYQPLPTQQLKKDKETLPSLDTQVSAATFALTLVPPEGILSEALIQLQPPETARNVQQELTALANKVIVADELSPENVDQLKRSVQKVCAYLNLGLEICCQERVDSATDLLASVFLENIFRLAHTEIDTRRKRLKTLLEKGWLASWPAGINGLEECWREEAELLLGKDGGLTRPASTLQTGGHDFIRYRRDLNKIDEFCTMLEEITTMADRLTREIPGDWQNFAASLWRQGQIKSLAEVTMGRLLFTATANRVWQGNWQLTPLPPDQWPEIRPLLVEPHFTEALNTELARICEKKGRTAMERYLRPLLKQYQKETEQAPEPEARFTSFFLFAAPPKS